MSAKFNKEIESFINDFVRQMSDKNAAIFAGAGMSKSAGYVDWPGLLHEIAEEIGLSVKIENDLISLAQYHVNENGGNRNRIIRAILKEFSEQAESTPNHKILARLPISTFWTTNYDTLIEDSLKEAQKVVDVKHEIKQLNIQRPKRDVVIYKMHGDVHHPEDAILTKEQYEYYYRSHESFITALSADLISKTFLFIGFSFTDPNLDYVLSRLRYPNKENINQHYSFLKRETKEADDDEELYAYKVRKQKLRIDDLKRYGIKTILINEYKEITDILGEIERRFRKRTVFISGSAEVYGDWDRNRAQIFIHSLSKRLIQSNFRVVNGFGWGIGSAVINGALEAIYERPDKYTEEQLIVKPFPQFETGDRKLKDLWEDYRQRMISLGGIALFVFGNKVDDKGDIVVANGVVREFEIAIENGLVPIPIALTGYASGDIYTMIATSPEKYYPDNDKLFSLLKELTSKELSSEEIINKVLNIILTINK